jgi:serine protease
MRKVTSSMVTTATRRRREVIAALIAGALTVGLSGLPVDAAAARVDPATNHHGHKVEHPTVEGAHNRSPKPAVGAAGSGQLTYRGGVDGIGVTTGAPKVYLVFWGAGWGTAGVNGAGETTLSGDPRGVAPVLQKFFNGLGTGGELWSGVMSQYCEGVAVGTVTCSAAASHVGYPTGGALAGVWVDPSTTAITSSGSTATSPVDHDLAAEAILAAAHFGNTSAASNRNVQYVILSPTGTHPGGFNSPLQWCAWHDFNGDSTLVGGAAASPYGDIAFTNMPYVTDVGASCGANYVNASGGTLDGVTIVEGHEYAETITDQNPAGGWVDTVGYENGDKCAWVGVGGTGGAQNIALTSGSFPVQATWSNDGASCSVSHAIVSNATDDFSLSAGPTSVTVPNGGSGQSTVTTAVILGAPGTIALSVSGLPSGASASLNPTSVAAGSSSTLTITPTSAAAGTYALTVTGVAGGVSHTAGVSLVIPGLTNGGFESSFTGWSRSGTTSTVSSPVHSGARAAVTGSVNSRSNGDSSVTQTFVASGPTLSFWYRVRCAETVSVDWATATLVDNTASVSATVLPKTCTNTATWVQVSAAVTAGHSYTLKLTNHDNNSRTSGRNTYTVFDDVIN